MSKQSYGQCSARLHLLPWCLFFSLLFFTATHASLPLFHAQVAKNQNYSTSLLALTFFELATFERVSIRYAQIVRDAPQYQVLVAKFIREAEPFFTPNHFKLMQEDKQAKDQFLFFLRIPEFQLFLSKLLLENVPLRQFDTRFLPKKKYFPAGPEKITLGMYTPQSYALAYQESLSTTQTHNKFVLKYKEIAKNIIPTVCERHKTIQHNILNDKMKRTKKWNKGEGIYYRALIAMNGTSNNNRASLLFDNAIKTGLLSERQSLWAPILSCINRCVQIHRKDEEKIEELKQLLETIQKSLHLVPATLCNYVIYILDKSFHVIHDDSTIQIFISALCTMLEKKYFYLDEKESIQMLLLKLYCHNKQYTDALTYLKNILNEHEWTKENKFAIELLKLNIPENLEG